MNKLIRVAVAVIVAFALVIGGYYLVYLPYFCNITISITTPLNSNEQYLEDFMLIYSHMPKNKIPLAEELTDTKNDFRMSFYDEHKEDDYDIEIEITVEKGKTIVTYAGTITDNETGVEEPFEKEFVHDFVLTKDIQ